jgi:glycosyltransferase involved in cell wall biosynthesis
VPDIRWFARNEYEQLVIPDLRRLGLDIAVDGDAPAKLAVVMNHDLAGAVWRYSRRRRVPYVSYLWDLPASRIGGGRYDPVVSVAGRLLALPRIGRRYITRRGYYSRLRYVAARAAAAWTPSHASAADVARHFGLEASVVPYCYNSRLFTGAPRRPPLARSGDDGATLSLLTISRLVPPKNHEAVVRAAARLGAHVEVIGRGPSEASIQRLARRLHVSCRIRTGLSGEDVIAAYHEASVVVCPSRFEGLGLTGIEGAICGTPVVASDIPPHREFLGAAAHFFALDDDDALVRAIDRAHRAGPPPIGQFGTLTIDAAARRIFDRLRELL